MLLGEHMDKLLERFFGYVSFDTQSKPSAKLTPSSDGQLRLARALEKELKTLGLSDVSLDDNGCVMATLPANVDWPVPVIGFISHLDTSPDFSGRNVNPQVLENYRGGDIALGIGDEVLSPVMFLVLHTMLGKTLIMTDGKTLLGADDKAGIAEIITAMVRLKNSDIPHGDIRIAFTPDEEIGRGAQYVDLKNSVRSGLIPLMAVVSVSWNMKTSMRRQLPSVLRAITCIRAVPKV